MRTSPQLLGLAAIALLASAPLSAQSVSSGRVLEIAPYAGYMLFGNYLEGPLGTSLGTSAGAVYGAQLGLQLTPNISLYGNVASTGGDLRVGVPFLGGANIGSSSMLIYDGGLQLTLPRVGQTGAGISPFLQAGAGAIHHELSQSLVHSRPRTSPQTLARAPTSAFRATSQCG